MNRAARMVAIAVLFSGAVAFAEEPAVRVPARARANCKPVAGKVQAELARLDFEQLAQTIGSMTCVQYEVPRALRGSKPISLSKQEMSIEELRAWFDQQLLAAGYRLRMIETGVFRIEAAK